MTDASQRARRAWPRRARARARRGRRARCSITHRRHPRQRAGRAPRRRARARRRSARAVSRPATGSRSSGNRAALAAGARYLDRDLNRGWSDDALARLSLRRARGPRRCGEDDEQRELWAAIEAAFAAARGPVYVDRPAHHVRRRLSVRGRAATPGAARVRARVPGARSSSGSIERLDGRARAFPRAARCDRVALEGGQNDARRPSIATRRRLRIALVELGLVAPGAPRRRRAGARAARGDARDDLPRDIEIVGRHAITRGDGFRMEPGFANIQAVRRARCSRATRAARSARRRTGSSSCRSTRGRARTGSSSGGRSRARRRRRRLVEPAAVCYPEGEFAPPERNRLMPPTGLFSSTIGKKIVMAVTGVILVGFVIAHMSGNLLLFVGPEALNEYGRWLRTLLHGAGLWIARGVLLVAVVLHVASAWSLTRAAQRGASRRLQAAHARRLDVRVAHHALERRHRARLHRLSPHAPDDRQRAPRFRARATSITTWSPGSACGRCRCSTSWP